MGTSLQARMRTKGLCFLLAFAAASAAQTSFADEARSFAITTWDGTCEGSTRTWWDDMCMAWRKKMKSNGWNTFWNNFSHVRASKFADKKKVSWGDDSGPNGADRGDAAMLCTHGGYNDNGWYGIMHTKENGTCSIDPSRMMLGTSSSPGGKARFLHLSSCNSVRWDLKGKWFGPAAGGVHVITGFHGYMYIGGDYVDEYYYLARDGYASRGVGKVWVDEMHHVEHWYNSWEDVCPIALGFGDTADASANALNERYTSSWPDRSAKWMTYRWKSGCNPDGGPKLPN